MNNTIGAWKAAAIIYHEFCLKSFTLEDERNVLRNLPPIYRAETNSSDNEINSMSKLATNI